MWHKKIQNDSYLTKKSSQENRKQQQETDENSNNQDETMKSHLDYLKFYGLP